jgi:cobaltochelatase CobN
LEAESRGLWNADKDTLKKLKEHYLEFEGILEDLAGEGEYQGGNFKIISPLDDPDWVDKASDLLDAVEKRMNSAIANSRKP